MRRMVRDGTVCYSLANAAQIPRSNAALVSAIRDKATRNACEGWCDVTRALARARPRDDS